MRIRRRANRIRKRQELAKVRKEQKERKQMMVLRLRQSHTHDANPAGKENGDTRRIIRGGHFRGWPLNCNCKVRR